MLSSNKRAFLWTGLGLLGAGVYVLAATASGPDNGLTLNEQHRVQTVTKPTDDFSRAEKFEARSGGAATSYATSNKRAFSHPSANLDFAGRQGFLIGDSLFTRMWSPSPASTAGSDGLGPLFNARSCQSCHIHDGRGHPPSDYDSALSFTIKLLQPTPSYGKYSPHPVYGHQIQGKAVAPLAAEGRIVVDYIETPITLNDGEKVWLRQPSYRIEDLGYGPVGDTVMIAPRIAPPMIGLGLIEAIRVEDILALADPDDNNGDGLSGRAHILADGRLGRFGWQANNASIIDQGVEAFALDLGLSTPSRPAPWGGCTPTQTDCRNMALTYADNGPEIPQDLVDLVTFYAANLAVPARRDVNAARILRGKQVFYQSGCASCHRPKFVTDKNAKRLEHRFELIWPYSDFLLHDMGSGLADRNRIGNQGREWRTAPLWGIGLSKTVNHRATFLHDGRARTLLEAILWHQGEGQATRDAVIALDKDDRTALIDFLKSL